MKKATKRPPGFRHTVAAGLVLSAALGVGAPVPARAQTPEAEAPVQSVQVSGVRDPAIMPYKVAYEMLSKISSVGKDRVSLLIKVVSEDSRKPIPDLDIVLRGDKTLQKISMSPAGFLTIPLSKEAYDDNAEFLTNKKKGSLGVQFYLVPKLPADSFSYGDVADSIEAGRAALAQIVPWYWRMLMPSIKTIGICYPDKHQSVLVSNSAEAARPAISEENHNVTDAKVYCANFSLAERGIARDSVIAPPSGWDPIFR